MVLRLLLVEDHAAFRGALKFVLNLGPSMNSPSATAAAAGATCSVPSAVTFW